MGNGKLLKSTRETTTQLPPTQPTPIIELF